MNFLALALVTPMVAQGAAPVAPKTPTPGAPSGMVWVEPGTFTMGWDGEEGRPDERPAHRVQVDGFWLDETEVTNAQFARFVKATGYRTTAEVVPSWEDLAAQLPECSGCCEQRRRGARREGSCPGPGRARPAPAARSARSAPPPPPGRTPPGSSRRM